jgi:FkbM family methyltransferase
MLQHTLGLGEQSIQVADAGAAFFGEPAPYHILIDLGLGKLFAFEPDEQEIDELTKHLGGSATVLPFALGDGAEHTLYIGPKGLGMSSLLEPDPSTLDFFNLFSEWGQVQGTAHVKTRRLDDLDELPPIDFLKLDVQGSELSILEHGRTKLAKCVAVQTEISFITLYKNQPAFGDIDREMRRQGFIPHRFAHIKNWAISPTIRAGEPRYPFHQLLEADIVYIRDIIHPDAMDDQQIAKLAAIAHYVYASPDLTARCLLELEKRSAIRPGTTIGYYQWLNESSIRPGEVG